MFFVVVNIECMEQSVSLDILRHYNYIELGHVCSLSLSIFFSSYFLIPPRFGWIRTPPDLSAVVVVG